MRNREQFQSLKVSFSGSKMCFEICVFDKYRILTILAVFILMFVKSWGLYKMGWIGESESDAGVWQNIRGRRQEWWRARADEMREERTETSVGVKMEERLSEPRNLDSGKWRNRQEKRRDGENKLTWYNRGNQTKVPCGDYTRQMTLKWNSLLYFLLLLSLSSRSRLRLM